MLEYTASGSSRNQPQKKLAAAIVQKIRSSNIAAVATNRATITGSAATPWKVSTKATTPASTTNHAQRQVGSIPTSGASRLA